jgi:hypothetical protein
MNLNENETELIGSWIVANGKVIGDEICGRIDWLINHELKFVVSDWSGWEKLYFHPKTGKYWELSHPQGHMQGGGPPALRFLNAEQASQKYDSSRVQAQLRCDMTE